MHTQSLHVNTINGHTVNPSTFMNSQQNISDCMQCCSRCIVMYMICKTNDRHDIWETIIIPPTCTWHFLCDKMNTAKTEQGYWIVAHYVWKRSFMIFVPKNFSISISFSTFMAPKQPFTYNEFVIYHWLMPWYIQYHINSVSVARLDRIERNNV